MLFWRTKTAKQSTDTKPSEETGMPVGEAADPAPPPEQAAVKIAVEADDASTAQVAQVASVEAIEAATADADSDESKVVTLIPVRLTERLAEVGGVAEADEQVVSLRVNKNVIEPTGSATTPGQSKALTALRAALMDTTPNAHVLVLGPAGTGRRSSALRIASEIAKTLPKPADWIYAATSRRPDILKAFPVPAGTGERFVRDVDDALAKSSAMLTRLMASDSHQMTLAVLEEDHRQRSDGPLDQLKRRAESQNIALVKTADGFVLAPMHEGKVVRADVFRALPEALQRDVEAKVTALESELQALMGALPGNDIATDDRHLALSRQTAERAVKPNLAVARKLFPSDPSVTEVFDAIESDWTRRAADVVRRGGDAKAVALSGLHAIGGAGGDGAPVVLARSVSATEFVGEIGRDTAGAIAIRGGLLARANGGFLVIDAWRLVADPKAWAALSAALEAGAVQPSAASGLAVTSEPVPLQLKLVLIAERSSFARLKEIDPRVSQHFASVVSFEASATAFDVSDTAFGAWAAALADVLGLRRLSITAAAALYEDARSRAGDRSRVSLEIAGLVQTLRAADGNAADANRDVISKDDVTAALLRTAALNSDETIS